jgi:hypothetical protein
VVENPSRPTKLKLLTGNPGKRELPGAGQSE